MGDPLYAHGISLAVVLITLLKVLLTFVFLLVGVLLYIWWDEYDPSPNVFWGKTVRTGYVSPANNYDEYSSLKTIEDIVIEFIGRSRILAIHRIVVRLRRTDAERFSPRRES